MRETRIDAWCDWCWLGEEKRVPSIGQWTIGIVESATERPAVKMVDVCETHAVAIKDMQAVVSEAGARPEPSTVSRPKIQPGAQLTLMGPAKLRTVLCPVCRQEKGRATPAGHVWATHREDERPEVPFGRCTECGDDFDSPQGMTAHRRLVHDYDALTEALSGVKGYKVTGKERDL